MKVYFYFVIFKASHMDISYCKSEIVPFSDVLQYLNILQKTNHAFGNRAVQFVKC